MNSQFSHLVWLGAGTASEPANLLNIAEHVTLIEAREAAYQYLKKKNTQTNVDIKQQLVCVTSNSALFTEYNLAEYSAVNPATGLKTLFPGLRKVGAEQLTSVAITDTIAELSLSGSDNALVIDIPDTNLALLQAIQQSKQISLFKNIYVHTALEPLYKGSSISADVIAFMESCGYDLLQKNDQDPELPWLIFFANPLWVTLQKTRNNLAAEQQANAELGKELAKSNLAINALQQANSSLKQELEKANKNLLAQQEAKEALGRELEKAKQDSLEQLQTKEILKKELEKTRQYSEQQLTDIKQQLSVTQQEAETAKQNAGQEKTELTKLLQILEQQITEQKQKLEAETAQTAESKQELQKQEARLNEINTVLAAANKAKQDTERQLAAVKTEKEAILKQQKETATKFSSDAQIDEVISDLSAFFTGKSITYVDVGAYTGEILEKIVASKKITVREAHLYEPNPESFEALKDNFAETKIVSFHINNFAIGEFEKKVTLLPARSMTKIISSGDISDSRQDVFVSDVKNLDSEINRITERHIHLLKIDVEGYEMEVLRGAEQLLKNQLADVIYIEVGFNKNGTQQTYMGDIDNYLQGNGYRVFKIYEQKNEWIEDSPLLRRCNFAYMSASFAKSNPFKLTMTIAELKRELTKLQTVDKTIQINH